MRIKEKSECKVFCMEILLVLNQNGLRDLKKLYLVFGMNASLCTKLFWIIYNRAKT